MPSTAQSSSPNVTSKSALPSYRQQESTSLDSEQQEDFSELVSEVSAAVGRYCRRRPRVVAGCIFSLGFMFGWKLRPW